MNDSTSSRIPKNGTHVDLGIAGDQLRVADVTSRLGIAPTSGYNPNEPYISKALIDGQVVKVDRVRPSFGVWHFCTERLVASEVIEDHAVFLLDSFEPRSAGVREFVESSEYTVVLCLWYEGPCVGFGLRSEIAARLAALCQRVDVKCFQTPDEDDEEEL